MSSLAVIKRMGISSLRLRTVLANSYPSIPGIIMSETIRSKGLPYMASKAEPASGHPTAS